MSDNTIKKLKQVLNKYGKVLLIPSGENSGELFRKLSEQYGKLLETHNILLLTDIPDREMQSDRIYRISAEEMERIRTLYDTYEFSDHFRVLQPMTKHYGNLMNYVKNGVLTEEECFQTLLGE